LVQAAARLREGGDEVHLVFAGGDKGGRAHVEKITLQLGLQGQVHFLGFVPVGHMSALYEACRAVVMPTYFGPTNLPPLEAWTHGKPLVYSRHLAAQASGAALLVDPDSAQEIAQVLSCLLRSDELTHWTVRGQARLAQLATERELAVSELAQRIALFGLRRECWGAE
ncbi:MAG: glycosyltransferase, partial [Burkholderiales bacterium]